jgi:hypothetical protein
MTHITELSECCFKNSVLCTFLGLVLINHFISDIIRILYTLRQCVRETFKIVIPMLEIELNNLQGIYTKFNILKYLLKYSRIMSLAI